MFAKALLLFRDLRFDLRFAHHCVTTVGSAVGRNQTRLILPIVDPTGRVDDRSV